MLSFSDQVIYFGDSLRSDIFPSKRHAAWDTVMILEEMDAEIGTLFPDITFSNWDSEEPEGKNLKLMVMIHVIDKIKILPVVLDHTLKNTGPFNYIIKNITYKYV